MQLRLPNTAIDETAMKRTIAAMLSGAGKLNLKNTKLPYIHFGLAQMQKHLFIFNSKCDEANRK